MNIQMIQLIPIQTLQPTNPRILLRSLCKSRSQASVVVPEVDVVIVFVTLVWLVVVLLVVIVLVLVHVLVIEPSICSRASQKKNPLSIPQKSGSSSGKIELHHLEIPQSHGP